MKKTTALFLLLLFFYTQLSAQVDTESRVKSRVDSSHTNELVLIQEFEVKVPIKAAWDTYATKEGWEGAFAYRAELDFKVNGTIKTIYDEKGQIGDESTIVLHIINYVPQKLITLQAEVSSHFPEFIKEDEKDLFNLVYFEELGPNLTKVTSYGIGYKNNSKYLSLMKFFIEGNELSYNNMIVYLETGKKAKY